MIDITTFISCVAIFAMSQIVSTIFTANRKISKLVPSVIHTTFCIVLSWYCMCNNEYIVLSALMNWSIAYFVYDYYNHINTFSFLYLCYYISSILVFYLLPDISLDSDRILVLFAILTGELGNFMVYRVNYKIYTNKQVAALDRCLWTTVFLLWRNFIGFLIMFLLQSHLIRLTVLFFWSMGVWWGVRSMWT